jgi:hypothetical protein
VRRELGGFESAEAWTGASFPYNAVAVLRLAGRPQADRLKEALAAVQRRHPLLRARLERRGTRWSFEAGSSGPIPLRRVERAADDDWRGLAEEAVNSTIEGGTAPLVRCLLLASETDGSASEIVISFHHAIADATSGAAVCRQLLELCGGLSEEAAGAGDLPPRPDDLFPRRFRGLSRYPRLAAFMARQLAEEAAYLWRSRGARSAVPFGPARCRTLSVALSEKATSALIRRSRRERVPLNSALNAALLLAVQRHRYGGRAVPLRYFAFPDLRPYLEPPLGPETVGSYLTTMRFTIRLDAEERFWGLARRIGGQLYRSFRRGEKYLFCMTSPALLRMILRLGRLRFGSAALSYTGPLDFPSSFGELALRGIHGFVSNMPVGAEYTALARLFRGRLWWDVVYLDSDMDEGEAALIAREILIRLEDAARAQD